MSGYFSNLWEVLLKEAEDPETDLVEWMRTGAPVGWQGQLVPNGVFPTVDGDTASVEKSRLIGEMNAAFGAPFASSPNYKSFYDAKEHAVKEVERMQTAGCRTSRTWT